MELGSIYRIEAKSLTKVMGLSELDLDAVYKAIGITPSRLSKWIAMHGATGVTANGKNFLAPEYPRLSIVAFMYVDSVCVSGTDLVEIRTECLNAAAKTNDENTAKILHSIAAFAEAAATDGAALEFGHP